MKNWIFVVTNQKVGEEWVLAREIYETRLSDSFWGLSERTPNRRNLEGGDRVVFYVGHPECVFAGTATLASGSYALTEEDREAFSHGRELFRTNHGVRLADIENWPDPIPAKELVPALTFIENRQFWGTYFQGGVRGISDDDLVTIVRRGRGQQVTVIGDTADIESANEFALEAHLEEFIAANWGNVPWGRQLKLYEVPGLSGRQFPAGTWSIDFLAVDDESNALVVVELKRGQTSDATVGQVLRYMEWVEENVAEEGQEVRGLIVCKDLDDALRLAVRRLPDVSVLTYQVDFKLTKAQP